MKTKLFFSVTLLLFAMLSVFGQSPERFNYQAVVRGSGGSLIVNSQVGIKISILHGSTSGTAVCIEEFSPTTNDYGLVTLEIGSVNSVDFEAIDWSDGPYFVKIELDENGGTSYSEMGTSQLLSVPYSLHATTAGRTTGDSIWKKSANDIYYYEGNVGIGTTNPVHKIDVRGSGATQVVTDNDVFISNMFSYHDNGLLVHTGYGDGIDIARFSSIGFGYIEVPRMVIKDNGYIGIGTNSPTRPLDVVGDIKMGNDVTIWEGTRALSLRQDNLNSFVSNKANFVGNGSTDNGSLNLHGQGGLSLRYGNAGSAGTVGLYLSTAGNIGIGTTTQTSKLQVEGGTTWNDEEPLFSVKNKDGIPVFAVFNNGVRILVEDDLAKGPKGGFSIGGFDRNKGYAETYDFLRITPDTIRFLINNDASKGPKGGFSIGGFDRNKGLVDDFMNLTPTSSSYGAYNTLLGYNAGQNNSGNYNVFIGYSTGKNNTSGTANVLIGYESGRNNLGGSNNVFIGNQCGYYNTSGSYNTFLGYKAGLHNEDGTANVFLGQSSGSANRSGHNNVFLGFEAGRSNLTGDDNVFIGRQSGLSATEGSRNVFIGYQSGVSNLSGVDNSIIGHQAGYYNTSGTNNTFFGYKAGLHNTTANCNVFIGSGSGSANRTGAGNVYLGFEAGRSNLSGSLNVFIGRYAGLNELGSDKLYIDNSSTTTPLIWGDFNQDILRFNGYIMQDSPQAAYDLWIQGGTGGFTGGDNRNLAILGISESYGDQLVINYDNEYANGTRIYGFVGINNGSPNVQLDVIGSIEYTGSCVDVSDQSLKTDIVPIANALQKIQNVNGVYYHFIDKELYGEERNIGMIAQNLQKEFPEVVKDIGDGLFGISYPEFSAVLLEAIKEQQGQIEELKARNSEIDDLKAQIEELRMMVGALMEK